MQEKMSSRGTNGKGTAKQASCEPSGASIGSANPLPASANVNSPVNPRALTSPHHPRDRRPQLRRIVAHAVLKDRLHFLHIVNLRRRIAVQHHQVRRAVFDVDPLVPHRRRPVLSITRTWFSASTGASSLMYAFTPSFTWALAPAASSNAPHTTAAGRIAQSSSLSKCKRECNATLCQAARCVKRPLVRSASLRSAPDCPVRPRSAPPPPRPGSCQLRSPPCAPCPQTHRHPG